MVGGIDEAEHKGRRPRRKECAKDGSQEGEQRALAQNELDEATTAGADRDSESHLLGAGGGLGGHHVSDVRAGDEQDETGQETEDAEVAAIVLLELGDAGPGGIEDKLLIEKAVDGRLGRAAKTLGALGLESAVDGGEMLAERLNGGGRVDTGFQHQEGAVPVDAVLGGEAVHAEGQKDVGDSSLFGSGEIARADADDLEGLVAYVERAAEDMGIAAEAVIPVVPGEDRIGTGTGGAVIGGREQAAERGLKAEEREHVAGDINDVGLFHVVVGQPGDIRAVGVADGDEVGLVLDGIAHYLELRRGPVAVLDRLAVEAGHLAREDVEVAGIGDGERAPEQGVDKTEGGDTGADAEGEGKHSGKGGDLVATELPPAETYIGE